MSILLEVEPSKTFIHGFLSKLVLSALKRLPFDDAVIKDIACLDPTKRSTSSNRDDKKISRAFF